jgi:ribosomal protein S18 acetylase RimI-like enzyme
VTSSYRIREGGREDLPRLEATWRALAAHHREVSTGAIDFIDPDTRWPSRLAEFEQSFDEGRGILLIAEEAGEIAGFAFSKTLAPDPVVATGPAGELEVLVVTADRRGEGIGEALTRRSFELLREVGAQTVRIEVIAGNDSALRFYERFGAKPLRIELLAPLDAPAGESGSSHN